jgi:hypothetical protein
MDGGTQEGPHDSLVALDAQSLGGSKTHGLLLVADAQHVETAAQLGLHRLHGLGGEGTDTRVAVTERREQLGGAFLLFGGLALHGLAPLDGGGLLLEHPATVLVDEAAGLHEVLALLPAGLCPAFTERLARGSVLRVQLDDGLAKFAGLVHEPLALAPEGEAVEPLDVILGDGGVALGQHVHSGGLAVDDLDLGPGHLDGARLGDDPDGFAEVGGLALEDVTIAHLDDVRGRGGCKNKGGEPQSRGDSSAVHSQPPDNDHSAFPKHDCGSTVSSLGTSSIGGREIVTVGVTKGDVAKVTAMGKAMEMERAITAAEESTTTAP